MLQQTQFLLKRNNFSQDKYLLTQILCLVVNKVLHLTYFRTILKDTVQLEAGRGRRREGKGHISISVLFIYCFGFPAMFTVQLWAKQGWLLEVCVCRKIQQLLVAVAEKTILQLHSLKKGGENPLIITLEITQGELLLFAI